MSAKVIPLPLPLTPADLSFNEKFDRLWKKYPARLRNGVYVKPAKQAARTALAKALKRASYDVIDSGVDRLVAHPPEPEFVPNFSSWLNGDMWEDEYTEAPTASGPRGLKF